VIVLSANDPGIVVDVLQNRGCLITGPELLEPRYLGRGCVGFEFAHGDEPKRVWCRGLVPPYVNPWGALRANTAEWLTLQLARSYQMPVRLAIQQFLDLPGGDDGVIMDAEISCGSAWSAPLGWALWSLPPWMWPSSPIDRLSLLSAVAWQMEFIDDSLAKMLYLPLDHPFRREPRPEMELEFAPSCPILPKRRRVKKGTGKRATRARHQRRRLPSA